MKLTSKELKAYTQEHNLQNLFADKAAAVVPAEFQEGRTDPERPYRRFYKTVAGTSRPTRSGIKFSVDKTLPRISQQAAEGNGVPILINHDTGEGGLFGGSNSEAKDIVPIGRTEAGSFSESEEKAYIDFFIDNHETMPEAQKVCQAIDDERMTDVSVGGYGSFTCSFCDTRMGYFGCSEGHLPLMTIMLDKDGNETYDRDEAVDTEIIYAIWNMEQLLEMSMAWKGAIPGAELEEIYSEHIKHIFGDQQLFTFSELSGSFFKEPKQEEIQMSTPNDHAVELNQMREQRDKFKGDLDQANAKIAELQPKADNADNLQKQFDALKAQYTQLEKDLAEANKLKPQAEQVAGYTATLRNQLKEAKNKQLYVTEKDKKEFGEEVDKMTDISVMQRMLSEMNVAPETNEAFLDRIGANPKQKQEQQDNKSASRNIARTMAAY